MANEQENNIHFVQFKENHACQYDKHRLGIHGEISVKKRETKFQK